MHTLPTLSIGIPAYNEGKNIVRVLRDILHCTESGFRLTSIDIYCDGCTDDTVQQAKTVTDERIHIIDSPDRLGKTARLNQMFAAQTADILLMLDGDILIPNPNMITKMALAFSDPAIGIAGGNSRPHMPRTFFQRAVYSTFEVFDASRLKHNHGDNIFAATGSCLALRKSVAKKIRLPKIVNEDVYIYLAAHQMGWNFVYVPTAVVNYSLPFNLKDYIKQVLRSEPRSANIELAKYFPDTVDAATNRDFSWYSIEVLKAFLRNPLGVSVMIAINLVCLPFLAFVISHYKLSWFTASSTH